MSRIAGNANHGSARACQTYHNLTNGFPRIFLSIAQQEPGTVYDLSRQRKLNDRKMFLITMGLCHIKDLAHEIQPSIGANSAKNANCTFIRLHVRFLSLSHV